MTALEENPDHLSDKVWGTEPGHQGLFWFSLNLQALLQVLMVRLGGPVPTTADMCWTVSMRTGLVLSLWRIHRRKDPDMVQVFVGC